jgi:peptidoglycan/xylan/chitin deacetylase (PgdA/CDA1 family)
MAVADDMASQHAVGRLRRQPQETTKRLAGYVLSGKTARVQQSPEVTLTFDNGPEPEVTPFVLDVLQRRAIPATFFVLGCKLAMPGRRALAERTRAEGHWIGNHTWSHARPLGECAGEPGHAAAEIARTDHLLGDLRHPDRLFRPFGGGGRIGRHLLSPEARDHLAATGHTIVLWSDVPGDWHDPDGWPARALAGCLAKPRSVLVLHDLPTGAMRHLDAILGSLADRGVRFRQAFPDDCVPMRRGVADPARLAPLVAAG